MNRRTRKRAPRRKQTPDFPIRIEKLSHEGRGWFVGVNGRCLWMARTRRTSDRSGD